MKCKYCHRPAGFLKFKHKECEQKYASSIASIKAHILNKLSKSSLTSYNSLYDELSNIITSNFISRDDFDKVLENTVVEFIQKEPIQINGETLKEFIYSLPNNINSNLFNMDCYKKFWGSYFSAKFATLEDDQLFDGIQSLMADIKVNEAISKHIDERMLLILEKRVLEYLSDGIIDNEEERDIERFIECSGLLNSPSLLKSNAYQKLVQALVLQDIQDGRLVQRVTTDHLPILLGSKEHLLWIFNNVNGYEEKTGRRYVGGSQGISMKVCKGVYYRVGASKGHSVEYQYNNALGSGSLIVTNKNIYFIGVKQVKIGISKILSFEPYSDGIVLVKDGATPKPYTFVGFDSWFIVNAIQLLVD